MALVPTRRVRVKGSQNNREAVINATDFNPEIHDEIAGQGPTIAANPPYSSVQTINPPRVSPEGVLQALEDPIGYDPTKHPEPADRVRLREATPAPYAPSANPPTAGVSSVRTDPNRLDKVDASKAGMTAPSVATGPRPATNAAPGEQATSAAPARLASSNVDPQGGTPGAGTAVEKPQV